MSSADYNKIITTVNSVTPDYSFIPNQNDVIVIDTSNNRIGINTITPEHAIDVSGGKINTEDLTVHGDISVGCVNSHFVPCIDITYDLGTVAKNWRHLYINEIRSKDPLTIDPEGIGNNTGNVIIKGNLEVQGTQTIINSTVVDLSDNIITLDAKHNSQVEGGIEVRTATAGVIKKLVWHNNDLRWSIGDAETFNAGTIYGGADLNLTAGAHLNATAGACSNLTLIAGAHVNISGGTSSNLTLDTGSTIILQKTTEITKNEDVTSYIGRAAIGYNAADSDWASFSHLDMNNASSYCLLQNTDGTTYLNTANTKHISFRINDVEKMKLEIDGTGNANLGGGSNTNFTVGPLKEFKMDNTTGVNSGLGGLTGNLTSTVLTVDCKDQTFGTLYIQSSNWGIVDTLTISNMRNNGQITLIIENTSGGTGQFRGWQNGGISNAKVNFQWNQEIVTSQYAAVTLTQINGIVFMSATQFK